MDPIYISNRERLKEWGFVFLSQFLLRLWDLIPDTLCVVILQDMSLLPSGYLLHFRLNSSVLQKKPDYILLLWYMF